MEYSSINDAASRCAAISKQLVEMSALHAEACKIMTDRPDGVMWFKLFDNDNMSWPLLIPASVVAEQLQKQIENTKSVLLFWKEKLDASWED